jgi:hypothetical protein
VKYIFLNSKLLIPLSVFLFAFLFIPFLQLNMLSMMPGDIGDARLNNYFLENVFQFLAGRVDSLWHLSFFYPFSYVLGFSDNLFGTAPIYMLARLLNINSDTSFQIWFLFGYAANFLSAYYALRRLKGSVIAATIGALIFTFALPTTAHAGHAQLHYRFGLPLAIMFFVEFLNSKTWRYLLITGIWLVWQFYAGIYNGFFTLLLIASMTLMYLAYLIFINDSSVKINFNEFLIGWRDQSKNQKVIIIVGILFLIFLLILLFYPYLQVTNLYGAKRSWEDISIMLPRLQSYFLADQSYFWSSPDASIFSSLPMRHEHQMFIGGVPLLLAVIGFFLGSRAQNGATFILISGMLGIAMVVTLYVGGLSFWYLLHKLPLVSAIRAVSRVDQAFLFPIAYLVVVGIDVLRIRFMWIGKIIIILIIPMFIAEAGMAQMASSPKESWRKRLSILDGVVPKSLPENSILFFAQRMGPSYADELDAMWTSLNHNVVTLNGYSGLLPSGYNHDYGRDCAEIPMRVISYLKFINQSENVNYYRELMSRIVPIGFKGCDSAWLKDPPNISTTHRIYSQSEFLHLGYGEGSIIKKSNQKIVRLIISNSADNSFSALSSLGKPIRISWRFIDAVGQPLSGWERRKALPFDIPAKGELEIIFPLEPSNIDNATAVQISLVQENFFWAHDIGLQPFTIPLN